MAIIEVNHVTKEYRLGQMTSLTQSVLHALDRLSGRPTPKQEPFKALDDVDFKVEEGEILGIIGVNGAGKSTLLKLLACVSVPTKGEIKVRGSVAPLIEVGAGLHPELTARENIYLNGTILGIPRKVIKEKVNEIVEFSELEGFIDTPVKRYSSGMMIRLGFAVATSVDTDILIIDEVLAVGDLAFQRKCFDRMEDLIKKQGKTVLLVSHNIRQVERLCTRVMLLDKGRIVANSTPEKVCDLFYERSDDKIKTVNSKAVNAVSKNQRGTGEIDSLSVSILDESRKATDKIMYKADVIVLIQVKLIVPLECLKFLVGVHTTDFLYLTTHNSENQLNIERMSAGNHEIECHIKNFPLLPGVYSLRVGVTAGKAVRTVFYGENLLHFQVVTNTVDRLPITIRHGFFALDASWSAHRDSCPIVSAREEAHRPNFEDQNMLCNSLRPRSR